MLFSRWSADTDPEMARTAQVPRRCLTQNREGGSSACSSGPTGRTDEGELRGRNWFSKIDMQARKGVTKLIPSNAI